MANTENFTLSFVVFLDKIDSCSIRLVNKREIWYLEDVLDCWGELFPQGDGGEGLHTESGDHNFQVGGGGGGGLRRMPLCT